LKEIKLTWKQFEKYFRKSYLYEKYYDEKIKEFHELKLGQITMDAYTKIVMELLRCVPYLKDEKVRIQHFLGGLSKSYQDRIEFDKSKMLEDTIQKAKCIYD
jgi:hypothetical protein